MSVRTSISMPEELLIKLTDMAQKENRTISSMIQVCIKDRLGDDGGESKEDKKEGKKAKQEVKKVVRKKISIGKSL